jgi:hypothetical protein
MSVEGGVMQIALGTVVQGTVAYGTQVALRLLFRRLIPRCKAWFSNRQK